MTVTAADSTAWAPPRPTRRTSSFTGRLIAARPPKDTKDTRATPTGTPPALWVCTRCPAHGVDGYPGWHHHWITHHPYPWRKR